MLDMFLRHIFWRHYLCVCLRIQIERISSDGVEYIKSGPQKGGGDSRRPRGLEKSFLGYKRWLFFGLSITFLSAERWTGKKKREEKKVSERRDLPKEKPNRIKASFWVHIQASWFSLPISPWVSQRSLHVPSCAWSNRQNFSGFNMR